MITMIFDLAFFAHALDEKEKKENEVLSDINTWCNIDIDEQIVKLVPK